MLAVSGTSVSERSLLLLLLFGESWVDLLAAALVVETAAVCAELETEGLTCSFLLASYKHMK